MKTTLVTEHNNLSRSEVRPCRREPAQAAYVLPSLMRCYMPPTDRTPLSARMKAWLQQARRSLAN